MKQKTLLLFQLLLAVFSLYSVLVYQGNTRLVVPLLCLLGMLVVGKLESVLIRREQEAENATRQGDEPAAAAFDPLECLLRSKNPLLLTDAVHYLLKDLGLAVSRSPEHAAVDRLVQAPGQSSTLALKIVADVSEITPGWDKWKELEGYELGKGGGHRLLIIGSNADSEGEGVNRPKRYKTFSSEAQKILASKQIVGMTTLTLYKIYQLCKNNKVKPAKILELLHKHPGGVFQLEQYAKRRSQAA